jgi:hypothetical protein
MRRGPVVGAALAAVLAFARADSRSATIDVGLGADGAPQVRIFDAASAALDSSFLAYDPSFTGGVRVAAGDVNGDGVADLVTGSGPGAAAHVKVFDGKTGSEIRSFFAFDASFSGGVFVAVGDVSGDDVGDILVGADAGGVPQVKVFDGATGTEIRSFLAYDAGFAGGVRVAAGDVNGDDVADIVTGAGPGGGPHVKVFDGATGAEIRSFFAFDPGFPGGVYVAAGDIGGDGVSDLVVGADAGGAPQVKVFDGISGIALRSFFAYDAGFTGGVRVAAGDVNGDGVADIVTGAGAGGGPHVKAFSGSTGAEIQSFFAASPAFAGGIYVATGAGPFDTTPPVLTLPTSVTVDATTPGGAVVSYTATATDDVDGAVPVTCRPASGSTFPIGDTTVGCTASDSAGNEASGAFVVHVRGAADQLGSLLVAVSNAGPGSALADKVRLAQSYLADGNVAAACTTLDGFIGLAKAQSGKKLARSQADALIAAARNIESVLGC